MDDEEYDRVKAYIVSGVEVISEVEKDTDTPEYRAFHIRSSCPSERWGTRTIGFSLNCSKSANAENPMDTLEKYRREQAERILKIERGELPERPLRFLGMQIEGQAGKRMNAIASPDLSVSPSLLSKDLIRLLDLRPLEKSCFQEHIIGSPLYSATISGGDLRIETMITPSEHGAPACILGGDFFQKALKGREDQIIELVMPDHYRALANAARCKKTHVLVAGKYSTRRPRLERIKQLLQSTGMVGLILDEYPDIEEQSLTQKMITYASISRFVLVDDIEPSGHIREIDLCHDLKFITAILRSGGRASTAMQDDVADEVSFIKEFAYTSDPEFEDAVLAATRWADETVTERARSLNRKYSDWRGPDRILGD